MKRHLGVHLRPAGILRWSTLCILAGLTGCEERYVATEQDARMAGLQKQIDELDNQRTQLLSGEVPNNFHLPRVGYYHAEARDFFEYPYDFVKDGMHFINGQWEYFRKDPVPASQPSTAALKKVEAYLEDEEKKQETLNEPYLSQGGESIGATDALLMYWILSGNRGNFMPGAGFTEAQRRAGQWNREVEEKRSQVSSYSSSHGVYSRLVESSKASGQPVKAGQSVRGGFGSARSGSGGFFGG